TGLHSSPLASAEARAARSRHPGSRSLSRSKTSATHRGPTRARASKSSLHSRRENTTGHTACTGKCSRTTGAAGHSSGLIRIVFVAFFLGGSQIYLGQHVVRVE